MPFTVAPLDLSDDGAQAPGDWHLETTEQAAPIATSAFDPVSAEQDGNETAQVSYTVDLSALEQEHAAEPVVAEDAPLQIQQIDLPGDDDQTDAPLDFIAENATRRAQTSIEDAFSPPPSPPQELDDPFVEPAQEPQDVPSEAASEPVAPRVQQAVVSEFELDDASAAFLAQLDAAAAQFDVERPQAPTVAADAQPAQASSEPVSSERAQEAADAGIFGGFGDSDIDDDIRDVFLEEFDEELVNLGQLLPVWRAAPTNPETLRPIRRVFHTLKGSGRLVGASVLGEFSWKIESMLNRVLDNSRPASPAVVSMVELAYAVLPQFNAALRDQGRISADLPEIQGIAERVAAGEEVYYVPAAAAPVADAVAIPVATAGVFAASGGTPASVDSVLREILEAEVATHLDTVNGWLQASRAEPQLATEELLRAVHTMSGAFAMTDVPEITLVTTPAESYVKRLLAASVTPPADGLEALTATAAAIAATVTALRADAPLIPSFAPLTERLRALVDTLPEAQWPPQAFLDELDDVDAPGATADGSDASVELTGAQDLSQYLDAGALPSDAPASTQDAEDGQPQPDDAPIAVDELAEAEAEHDSALALDAPAPHAVDNAGHAAVHEDVHASAESVPASSDDALVPVAATGQLAESLHGDTAPDEEADRTPSQGIDAHDVPADEPLVEAEAWDATELQHAQTAPHAHAPGEHVAEHGEASAEVVSSEHDADATSTHADGIAVDELADAEAALGDAQTLAAADAEQAVDAQAQHVPAHDDQVAAGADEAVESIEALEAVHADAALADEANATTAEDWTPETAALDSAPSDQPGHEHADTQEYAGEQPADELAQHGDAARLHGGEPYAGQDRPLEEAAQLGEHAEAEAQTSSNQQMDSGDGASADAQQHVHEQVPSDQYVEAGEQLQTHAHFDEHAGDAEHATDHERIETAHSEAQHAEAEHVAAEQAEAEHSEAEDADADRVDAAQADADVLPDHTVESVQAFEMAHAADQVEEAGDPQSDTAPELYDTQTATSDDAAQADAQTALDAFDVVDHADHAERAEQFESAGHAAHAEQAEASDQAGADQHAEDSADQHATDRSADELEDTAAAAFSAPVEDAARAGVASNDIGAAFDAGPLNFDQLDGELVDIFVEEGRDLLDHCDGLIARMREVPGDRDVLNGLQRDLHTLKGGARMAGINAIGDLGHAIESLLEAVAANRTDIDRDDVRLFERGFDRLHQLLTRTGMHRAVTMPTDLVEAFETRTRGRNAAAPSDADVRAIAKASVEPAPLSAPVPVEGQAEEDFLPRAQQEQVRVRADLLDRLVNHAGEVAIYRSRLEQQLGAFRGAMGELDRTNARLRDQLRRLDLETEAQIVARYQREQDQGDRTFDPLELDRFSTLQQLSRALNESAADLGGLQGVLEDLSRQYDGLLQQQSRVSSELQDGLMRARMVPFDGLVPRLRRVVRQAASDTGKQVHLVLEGTQGELDRNVLDRMVAPLEHMLRNSVAHGLETPEQRRDAGKPEEGSIAIRLRREGSEIVLEVADDGAGLDREAIRRRGEERGLIEPGQELSEAELDNLIFASGFSTSDQVSQLAGRGVGMDVVRNEVRQLGGSVDIHSVRGQGATFTLRLPQTLAVTQAVFVRIGETTFAVPVGSVSGIGRISRTRYESGEGGYHYAGEEYVLHDLGSLVGQPAARADGQAQVPLLLVRAGDLRAAVAIDQVLGNREVVVKPVGLQIASVPGIYGATITGDGRVVVILDVAPLVRRFLAQPARPSLETQAEAQRQVPLVMVVDDSLTMRKVTSRVLERHNLDVSTARDGVEALELLEERVPDLMLLDIEMPRMDGYELATAMRADPRFKAVPIVMITSRSGEKHRQRAFEIGVQRYLGKPYQELDLMRNVYDLLGIARVRD